MGEEWIGDGLQTLLFMVDMPISTVLLCPRDGMRENTTGIDNLLDEPENEISEGSRRSRLGYPPPRGSKGGTEGLGEVEPRLSNGLGLADLRPVPAIVSENHDAKR